MIEEEFVGGLRQVRRGSAGHADDDTALAELTDRLDQRHEVTVARDQHERLDVRVAVQHLHGVNAQEHIHAVLDRSAFLLAPFAIVIGGHIDRVDLVRVQGVDVMRVRRPVGICLRDRDAPVVL